MLVMHCSLQQFSFLDERISIIRKWNVYEKVEGMLSTDLSIWGKKKIKTFNCSTKFRR